MFKRKYNIDKNTQIINLLGNVNKKEELFKDNIILKYHVKKFPDGQKSLSIISNIDLKKHITIICRIKSGNDLLLLGQVTNILHRLRANYSVVVTYLTAARSDRVFNLYQSLDLEIVMSMLDKLTSEAEEVIILDPHNFKAIKRLSQNKSKYKNISIHAESVSEFQDDLIANIFGFHQKGKIVVVYPDEITFKRLPKTNKKYMVFNEISEKNDKKLKPEKFCQDASMFISSTNNTIFDENEIIETLKYKPEYQYIIVDDLCDDGSTFINIAKWFEESGIDPKTHISLLVTHMVQNEGLNLMCNIFKTVITTNSYCEYEHMENKPKNLNIIPIG